MNNRIWGTDPRTGFDPFIGDGVAACDPYGDAPGTVPGCTGPDPVRLVAPSPVAAIHYPGPARNPFALSNERSSDDRAPPNTAFLSHHVVAAPPRGLFAPLFPTH